MKTETEIRTNDDDDGCGVCLPCRFKLMLGDMTAAAEMLRRGETKKAESLLCAAIVDGEDFYANGDWDGDEEDEDDDYDLGNAIAAGRA